MRAFPVLTLVLALGLALGFAPAPSVAGTDAAPGIPTYRWTLPVMGTTATVSIASVDSAAAARAARDALRAIVRVDLRFSNWKSDSEISRVNRELADGPVELSASAREIVDIALEIARASGGAFDPTVEPLVRLWGFLGGTPRVPPADAIEHVLTKVGVHHFALEGRTLRSAVPGLRIDLGGIAKGHAVDAAAAVLREAGVERALVDLSGNMVGLGHPPAGDAWTLGVRDPDRRAQWFARLRLQPDEAVATSGNYEQFVDADGRRHGHVLDPRTGWPVDDLVAVTVLAPRAVEADAWATALLVMGTERARRLLAEREDLTGILVQSARAGRHEVWVEDSLRDRIAFVTDAGSRFAAHWFASDPHATR